jgi:adenine-specific DNA-methyltransferase
MDKLKLHTPDLTAQNIEKLAALFPNCITETTDAKGTLKRGIDFDQLRQELSDHVVEGPRERYHLDWPGKREALLAANAPIAKTLRPCREESVDFDTTKNLFIEGDNLDALKLLQETYLGKVKMIYIDPPYNTGNDFIYDDDFAESTDAYLRRSNQVDNEGNQLVANKLSNGRFHSDWITMIYPRLKLARNLLRDDGVIFISVDDIEVTNTRKACDEIFGDSNFIAQLVWEGANKNDARQVGVSHEYAIIYAKERNAVPREWSIRKEGVDEALAEISRIMKKHGADFDSASDELAGWYRSVKAKPAFGLRRFRYVDQRGAYKEDDPTAPGGRRFELKDPRNGNVIPLRRNRGWSFDQDEFNKMVSDGRVSFITATTIMIRRYLHETDSLTPPSVFYQPARSASERLAGLLGPEIFDFPKDEIVLSKFIEMATGDAKQDAVILDFFAGSGTTAHAVLDLNTEDGGARRFILVQLPELCASGSAPSRSGYATIADITKERIRRAGAKIKAENATTAPNLDIGFRVLKIDTSNMKDVYYAPDYVKQGQLELLTDNIKEDRSPEDLLFQVLVDWGVDLALPITQETIAKKKVFFVDGNALAACFDPNITEELVKELAKKKPLRAVFRDSSYGSDSVKINVEQIFKLLSPGTELKSL